MDSIGEHIALTFALTERIRKKSLLREFVVAGQEESVIDALQQDIHVLQV
jgi:hypothetical protein